MRTLAPVAIDRAFTDPRLFKPLFAAASWRPWLAVLRAAFGLRLSESDLALYRQCTDRGTAPERQVRELWIVAGRRAGKSRVAAAVAVYLAAFFDHAQHLAPGERGTVMLVASDRKQARILLGYVRGVLREVPALARMVERESAESIDLANRTTIEVHTCSLRSTRGYTLISFIGDETAFWSSEDSAEPDTEVIAAVRPDLATLPNAMLICISSPYSRRGAMYRAYADHYGQDHPGVLVWQAPTLTMNPAIDPEVIAEARRLDPVAAQSEYDAVFRADVEAFLPREWIEASIMPGRHELPPVAGVQYCGFADPSGGAVDSFTLAICHAESDGTHVVDVARAVRAPFQPETVVRQFAEVLRRYDCTRVVGDKYAGQWVVDAFRREGIVYEHASLDKSAIYIAAEPLFAQGVVRLPDNPVLANELSRLERRPGRLKDIVDHPRYAHDDLANAVCGAMHITAQRMVNICEEDFHVVVPDDESRARLWAEFESRWSGPAQWEL